MHWHQIKLFLFHAFTQYVIWVLTQFLQLSLDESINVYSITIFPIFQACFNNVKRMAQCLEVMFVQYMVTGGDKKVQHA